MARELILGTTSNKIYIDDVNYYQSFKAIDDDNNLVAIIAQAGTKWCAIILNEDIIEHEELEPLLQHAAFEDCKFYEIDNLF